SFLSFLLFILVSCNQIQKDIKVQNTIITVEVTRIIQDTPTPNLEESDIIQTRLANEIGTPIVADASCYETALSQLAMNECAHMRVSELENQMNTILQLIQEETSEERYEQLSYFQIEWQDFSVRECTFLSGAILNGNYSYEGGSMAPLRLGECLVSKYEDRLRELQIYLFENSR